MNLEFGRLTMALLIELKASEAKKYFLRNNSYFNGDLPHYIGFGSLLRKVDEYLKDQNYRQFSKKDKPEKFADVNYSLLSNKDGRFAWRPLELMHPVLYVSLVNLITKTENWSALKEVFKKNSGGVVQCCSMPIVSHSKKSDKATQIEKWWEAVEQRSIAYSLEFTSVLHTDVTDCYGSLYTHSIPWAIHGVEESKKNHDISLLGNDIDLHIRAGRYGQTNGISQGSTLMDFIAELTLAYVDNLINNEIGEDPEIAVIRYRDDYRIFANSDADAENCLQVVSKALRCVGMRLNNAKTGRHTNVIEGSIKPDKLSAVLLDDLGVSNATTIQKQLLRLHSFGMRHPNSGALRRLLKDFYNRKIEFKQTPNDLEALVAIAVDIATVSPATMPFVAAILSKLMKVAKPEQKKSLWLKVRNRMMKVANNGYMEVWLQRVTKPKTLELQFGSNEQICKIVDGEKHELWNSGWLADKKLLSLLQKNSIILSKPEDSAAVVSVKEVDLFQLQNLSS
jgi:RNA-directed DNA polymerase